MVSFGIACGLLGFVIATGLFGFVFEGSPFKKKSVPKSKWRLTPSSVSIGSYSLEKYNELGYWDYETLVDNEEEAKEIVEHLESGTIYFLNNEKAVKLSEEVEKLSRGEMTVEEIVDKDLKEAFNRISK